jgi:hypothetical protein
MNISIIAVDREVIQKKKGPGTYEVLNVTYKNHTFQDKVESKKLVDFATDKDLYKTVGDANKGDTFSIEREKDATGQYWNWVGIARQDGTVSGAASSSKPTSSVTTKSTYQTPEERAAVQLYIIRQSSIASAVNLTKDHGTPTADSVIEIARKFEEYVLGIEQPTIENLSNDIPY